MVKKVYYTNEQIKGFVSDIMRQIHKDQWKPDYVVGLTRGGLIPAVMVSHYLDVPMYTLKVSLRDSGDSEINGWMPEDAFGYKTRKKNILIVDDINDSGDTLNWIKKDWEHSCLSRDPSWKDIWNNSVRFAVLVDNESSQADVNYSAVSINKAVEDQWIVFPWEEWYAR